MKLFMAFLMTWSFMQDLRAQQPDSSVYKGDSEVSEEEVKNVEPDQLPSMAEYKSEKLDIKKFDPKTWKEIAGSTNFDEKPPELKAPRRPLFKLAPWSGAVLKIITYVLIIGIAILIIYYVMKNASIGTIKAKNAASAPGNFPEMEENIESFDMEEQLRLAQAGGNLRLVVRIHYLGLLKKLNDAEKIVWKKDKTNLDYLTELFSKNYFYEEVRKLTMAYEIMWYGERTISREPFDSIIRDFESLYQQISIEHTS